MTDEKLKIPSKRAVMAEMSRRNIIYFAQMSQPSIEMTPFHLQYYRILESFARGKIKKLIITIPPQHGKSLGSSVMLPSYMLGLNPDLRICIASYSLSLAAKFNRQVQRTIDTKSYAMAFPATSIKSSNAEKNYIRTADEFEIVGRKGSLISVGREGALTGNQVDIMILDDLYKDAMEANSQVIRNNAWDWYTSVVRTRLHNDSQEIIVFTRWHEQDIIGAIAKKERVREITSADMSFEDTRCWYRLNFEAIKSGAKTDIDPRQTGEALWPSRHNIELLNTKRALDHHQFECMYQGNPAHADGLLYGKNFKTYINLPSESTKKANYTDTADMGDDFLCSVCYDVTADLMIYISDITFTRLGMEHTETAVAQMLNRNQTRTAYIESNNGGRGFARNVQKLAAATDVQWFHQSANKEARILTNQATVLRHIHFPSDWHIRWSEFYGEVVKYRRNYRSNRNHDAADVLTGIIEREIFSGERQKIKMIGFSR